MISLTIVRVSIVIVVALLYALFDLFNKREVPDLFVYATVALGAVLLLTYNLSTIILGGAVAALIALFGYVIYREGWLGAGDVLELAFIALALPVQMKPIVVNVAQFNVPFVLSVFIGAGYSVTLFLPVYYLLFVKKSKEERNLRIPKRRYVQGLVMVLLYAALIVSISYLIVFSLVSIILILLIAIPATIVLIFEQTIYFRMVSFVYPSELGAGDMIAVNLMEKKDLVFYQKRTKLFGRLATKELISAIRKERKRLPVYRNSVPFALFIFLGVLLSVLLGNIVFLIV